MITMTLIFWYLYLYLLEHFQRMHSVIKFYIEAKMIYLNRLVLLQRLRFIRLSAQSRLKGAEIEGIKVGGWGFAVKHQYSSCFILRWSLLNINNTIFRDDLTTEQWDWYSARARPSIPTISPAPAVGRSWAAQPGRSGPGRGWLLTRQAAPLSLVEARLHCDLIG